MTAMAGREVMMAHILTYGNGYAEIVRDTLGRVQALWPIPPNRIKMKWDNKELIYVVQVNNEEIDLNYCSPRYELVPNKMIFSKVEEIFNQKGIEFSAEYSHTQNARFYGNYTIEDEDFSYTLGYDSATKIVTTEFIIPSGEATTVFLNVTRYDALGTAVCTDTLTSTAGTLSCVVPNSFGNATVIATLTKDGSYVASGTIKLNQDPSDIYGTSLIFLGLFVMLTLIGAAISDNPVYTIIFFMVA